MKRLRFCITFTSGPQEVIDGYESSVLDGVLYVYTDPDLRSRKAFVLANVKSWVAA